MQSPVLGLFCLIQAQKPMSYLMSNYTPLKITFTQGKGCWLTDTDGEKYLDALSGVGVVGLGHCHPVITQAIQRQAEQLLHTSNWYQIAEQENLAQKLCQLANMDKAFFCNSGAEAIEAGIKITRLFAKTKNISEPIIITARQSFHGRTMGALSATNNTKIQAGFAPLLNGFLALDFNDIKAIEAHTNNPNIVAVLLEPIQGESGVIIPDDNYLNQVQKICQANNWLLMLDEVQTGMGRSGKLFAHQYNNITPDLLILAKGLANGLPIGACLAKGIAADLFTPGAHGSTFGGNPLVCKTALTVLEVIKQESILANVIKMGDYLLTQLEAKLKNSSKLVQIRAKGLMIAIQLKQDCSSLLQLALNNKLLINITGRSIRLLPPLIIKQNEADILITKIVKLINDL